MSGNSTHSSDTVLGALVDVLHDVVFVYDEQLVCRSVGRGTSDLFGIDPASVLGQTRATTLERIGAACTGLGSVIATLNEQTSTSDRREFDPVDVSGHRTQTLTWMTAPILHEGRAVGRIDIVRDVTRLRELERAAVEMARKLEEATLVDALTSLGNLRRFEEECEREHRRAQRVWDSYAVARMDVDGMAAINAAHGHAKGDSLLRLLGERLRSSRRQYDIVARWGGDDFALLLPCIDRTAVKRVLIRAASQVVEAAREAGFEVTMSVGVAVWTPPSADSATDVLGRATAALEAARSTGSGNVHLDLDGTNFKNDPFASIAEPPERVD